MPIQSPVQFNPHMHMGPEDPSNRKKYPFFLLMPNFRKLRDDSKYVSLKIGSWKPQKLGPFSSLFLMRKTLSSCQKWFLRPFPPLIRGMFPFRNGLRFWFRIWPQKPLLTTGKCFSHEEKWGKGPNSKFPRCLIFNFLWWLVRQFAKKWHQS